MQFEQQANKARGEQGAEEERVGSGKMRRFKRVSRPTESSGEKVNEGPVMGKRNMTDTDMMDAEVGGGAKRSRGEKGLKAVEENTDVEAGLSEQPCRKQ
jgi:hypothetical protein